MSVIEHRRQGFLLYEGQVLDGLAQMADESVHCAVTSPPYWALRDYQVEGQLGLEPTFAEFQEKMVTIFREVRRVLRSDGTCWVNLGDSFVQGATGKTNNKKSLDASGGITAWQKSRSWSTSMPGLKRKDMLCMPFRIAMALQADGWWLRQAIIWCLSGGASVYAKTASGERPVMIKDLVRMKPESVKLWNGEKWTQVLGFSASTDTGRTLEIELRSGERIGCTGGHQWPTQRGLVRADELVVGDVIQTTTLPEPETRDLASPLVITALLLTTLAVVAPLIYAAPVSRTRRGFKKQLKQLNEEMAKYQKTGEDQFYEGLVRVYEMLDSWFKRQHDFQVIKNAFDSVIQSHSGFAMRLDSGEKFRSNEVRLRNCVANSDTKYSVDLLFEDAEWFRQTLDHLAENIGLKNLVPKAQPSQSKPANSRKGKMPHQYWIKRSEKIHGPFDAARVLNQSQKNKFKTGDRLGNFQDGPWALLSSEHLAKMQTGADVVIS